MRENIRNAIAEIFLNRCLCRFRAGAKLSFSSNSGVKDCIAAVLSLEYAGDRWNCNVYSIFFSFFFSADLHGHANLRKSPGGMAAPAVGVAIGIESRFRIDEIARAGADEDETRRRDPKSGGIDSQPPLIEPRYDETTNRRSAKWVRCSSREPFSLAAAPDSICQIRIQPAIRSCRYLSTFVHEFENNSTIGKSEYRIQSL